MWKLVGEMFQEVKKASLIGMNLARVDHVDIALIKPGKIVEERVEFDMMNILQIQRS
ncbi:MAG: hypothetical protein ABSF24_07620 [Candidatus Bathyarchaeia archaeon]|jgi:hypothetical protein